MRAHKALWWLIAAAIMISIIPYAIVFFHHPVGWRPSGISPLAPADTAVYYSYIEQGRQGHVIMSDLFTTEHYAASLWQPLWFVVGQLANILHLSTPWAYALARTLSIPALVSAIWWLTGWLWKKTSWRVTGTSLALFGGGLGALVHSLWPHTVDHLGYTAPDQWVSEAFPNLSLLGSAHFLLITAGIIVLLVSVERSWEELKWNRMLWACLAAIGVTIIHPFHVITWATIAIFMTALHWRRTKHFPVGYIARWLVVASACAPALILYAWQLHSDPVTIDRAIQNINMSPALWRTVLGLGLTAVLALFGAAVVDWRDQRWQFVGAWGLATVVAMYAPLDFQRRLSQGLYIPWAMLATPAIMWLWSRWRQPMRIAGVALGGGLLLSSLVIAMTMFPASVHKQLDGQTSEIYLLSPDAQAAVKFLRQQTDQITLGTVFDANALAGFTGHHVLVGHPVETLNFVNKFGDLLAFYQQQSDDQRQTYLQRSNVCYLYQGPQERQLGPSFHPENWPNLKPVWSSPTVTIFQTPYCAN